MIRITLWLLLLTGIAHAQCAGGISQCPLATVVNPTDWAVISQPGGTGPTGYVTRKASIEQFLLAASGFSPAITYNWTAPQNFAAGITVIGPTPNIGTMCVGGRPYCSGMLQLTIPPGGANQALNITSSPSGSLVGETCSPGANYNMWFGANCINTVWNANAGSGVIANFLMVTQINGGAAQAGSAMFNFASLMDFYADANVTNASVYGVLGAFSTIRQSPAGQDFYWTGFNNNVNALNTITWPAGAQVLGEEIDLGISSPGLAGRAFIKMVMADNTSGNVQAAGAPLDFDALIYAQTTPESGAFGYRNAFLLDATFGKIIATNGCVLCTRGTATIANFIDGSAWTYTGFIFNTTNFNVDGAGNAVFAGSIMAANEISVLGNGALLLAGGSNPGAENQIAVNNPGLVTTAGTNATLYSILGCTGCQFGFSAQGGPAPAPKGVISLGTGINAFQIAKAGTTIADYNITNANDWTFMASGEPAFNVQGSVAGGVESLWVNNLAPLTSGTIARLRTTLGSTPQASFDHSVTAIGTNSMPQGQLISNTALTGGIWIQTAAGPLILQGASAIQMPTLTSTPGPGGVAVCIDTNNNLYKKTAAGACP